MFVSAKLPVQHVAGFPSLHHICLQQKDPPFKCLWMTSYLAKLHFQGQYGLHSLFGCSIYFFFRQFCFICTLQTQICGNFCSKYDVGLLQGLYMVKKFKTQGKWPSSTISLLFFVFIVLMNMWSQNPDHLKFSGDETTH